MGECSVGVNSVSLNVLLARGGFFWHPDITIEHFPDPVNTEGSVEGLHVFLVGFQKTPGSDAFAWGVSSEAAEDALSMMRLSPACASIAIVSGLDPKLQLRGPVIGLGQTWE